MNAERLLAHYHEIADAPDAIARLRRFILDLAVRGKLVPQDAGDEPASELLKQIAKEKARLVMAGEIRKPKVFRELDEPPFDVPQNWRWTRIREVASDRGQEIPQSTFTYIDVTAIDKEAGVVADPKVLEASEAPSRARKVTRKGDVIYSCVRPYLLNVAVIETDFNPQPIASTAFAILNGHGFVLSRYLWIVLRSPFMVECVEENQRGQAYPAINDADFAVLPFPLPPLAEQHRIVAKVDELMGLCDQLEAARGTREAVRDRLTAASLARLNAPDPETFQADAQVALDTLPALTARPDQIKQLRQTILNLAVRGKLVPQEPSDEPASELLKRISSLPKPARYEKRSVELIPGDCGLSINDPGTQLPKGWLWAPLVQIARLESGHTPSRSRPDWWGGDVPWIGLVDARLHNNGTIFKTIQTTNKDGLANSAARLLPKGTVCFSRTASVGYVVIMGQPMATSQDFVNWVPTGAISSTWLQLVMVAERPAIDRFSKGAVHQTIYYPAWLSMHIALPPLAEQHRIVAKVDALMVLCDRLEASLTTAADTRRRLLDALLAEALAPAEERELEAAE
ncbi:restriction endonuclease subunit S [Bradyrhizobium sp. AUGA SZCCT0042]|uniref:restriction endonuclease subunit S n=1 Tax=Bradyrhizobium sp. AUGA SZCCT0042 TaxID=2807651 RepID=UPI001BA6E108|nr:restriction endonuclease subunit S [Bradyrhizobium sp. AUGA SZCCT0042]MBR1296617.1 restriction endonuclease subunit S [Bradyrhizobium sp. AUGA SZCCT0042]